MNSRLIQLINRSRYKEDAEPMAPLDPWRLQEIIEDCARETGSTITEFKIR